jgi:hypothetical protein
VSFWLKVIVRDERTGSLMKETHEISKKSEWENHQNLCGFSSVLVIHREYGGSLNWRDRMFSELIFMF